MEGQGSQARRGASSKDIEPFFEAGSDCFYCYLPDEATYPTFGRRRNHMFLLTLGLCAAGLYILTQPGVSKFLKLMMYSVIAAGLFGFPRMRPTWQTGSVSVGAPTLSSIPGLCFHWAS
jgi:hypothetical protein